MRQNGRAHVVVIFGFVGLLIALFFVFFSGSSPEVTAAKFMVALGQGDAEALSELSYDPGRSQEELKTVWAKSLDDSEFFRFTWKVTGTSIGSDEDAVVKMMVVRDVGAGGYEEAFDLRMQKIEGEWKVLMSGISREMYPWLPSISL